MSEKLYRQAIEKTPPENTRWAFKEVEVLETGFVLDEELWDDSSHVRVFRWGFGAENLGSAKRVAIVLLD